jgi:hypothetical protein
MNEVEVLNILLITKEYKHMCISIDTFTDFLRPEWRELIDPVTQINMLKQGLYGSLGTCNIWVCKTMESGYIKVSNQDIVNAFKDTGKWSPPVLIKHADQLERYVSLKAFW